jgi:hypothetical protein
VENGQDAEQGRRHPMTAAAWGFVALFGIGFLVVTVALLMIGLSEDGCTYLQPDPRCDADRRWLAACVVIGGWAAGILLALIGGGLAQQRQRTSAVCQVAAWCLTLVGIIVAFNVISE